MLFLVKRKEVKRPRKNLLPTFICETIVFLKNVFLEKYYE